MLYACKMGHDKMPYIAMIITQTIYAGLFIVSKAAFDKGLSPFVFLFYRQAVASLVLLPFAIVAKRGSKEESRLSFMVLLKIFMLALIGITTSLDVYHIGLTYTSETIASAAFNSIPVDTFLLAFLLRMETLNLRKSHGMAKAAGVLFCLAGVIIMAFYAGPAIHPLNHHQLFHHNGSHEQVHSKVTWIKGTFLLLCAFMAWSLWLVLQGLMLKECPSKILLTTTQCVFSTLQSLIVALAFERDFSTWKLAIDVRLLAVIYTGVCSAGIAWYLQAWCIEKKGPVFCAMWTPLSFIFTTFSALLFVGKTIRLGSVLGGILMVVGLYSVLWGKNKERNINEKLKHQAGAERQPSVALPADDESAVKQKVDIFE